MNIKLPMYLFFIWRLEFLDFDGANTLLGPLEGMGLDNLDFLGPNGTRFARCHFRAQKSLNVQCPPLPMASKWICSPSKSLVPAPYKQEVRVHKYIILRIQITFRSWNPRISLAGGLLYLLPS
jgi:hypothetical protein